MNLNCLNCLVLIMLFFASCQTGKQSPANLEVSALRVEWLTDPEGIDAERPCLSWEISGDRRGIEQSAFHILVASSPDKLAANEGDLWDSQKISSDQSVNVAYAGKPLESRMQCWWKVKVWDDDSESEWSKPAYWSMGLLHYKDWRGRWIGLDRSFPWEDEGKFSRLGARYFRKEFESEKEIKRAVAYIIGLGLYELHLNGQKVGDQVLAPTPTDYTKNVKYNVFDVTGMLNQGSNAVGIVLGNGRYFTMRRNYKPYKIKDFGYPKMLFQLEIEYADGTTSVLRTDNSWKVTPDGPIRSNNEYDGEEYDARKEMPGWDQVGFNDAEWLQAEYVQEPRGDYEAQMNDNMKVMETIKPVSLNRLGPDTYILDMGQNMVGWVRMKVDGRRGDQVTLRFAEILNNEGGIFTANLRDARSTDVYTLKGGGEEVWEPSFVYHGFRYVEIKGYPGEPTVDDFEGRVVYDDMAVVGRFETSNEIINQVYQNASWGIKGNYKGMPVDCPQRNERQPWLGDRPTVAYGETFMFDNGRFYAKWLEDIRLAQKGDGALPDVAPAYWNYYSDNMTWPGTYLMIADMLYRQYGDLRSVKKHYPFMKKWLAYMRDRYMTKDYIVTKDSYGDWCAPPATIEEARGMSANVKRPSQLISTAYYYRYLQMMERFARLSGNEGDIKGFEELAEQIKQGFNRAFFKPDSAYYGGNTLTDNLLAYSFDLVPEKHRDAVFQTIENIIEERNQGHLSTGVVGTQWLMRCLTGHGRGDLAYRLAANTTYPSWGYMVENGATTIWELWNGNTAAPNMNSYNHVMMLGDLVIWYYEDLAGIKSGIEEPGFKQIEMKPLEADGLDYVKASYHSIRGVIRSEWKKENGKFTWDITIPGNAKAMVYIPATDDDRVTEGGVKVRTGNGIRFLGMQNDRAVYEVGSGEYSFESVF